MFKSCVVATVAAVALLTFPARAQDGRYPFGDEPYRLNWYADPEISSGCWRWNWQQYQWNDYCPTYIRPKAYIFPRARAVVLRSKG